MSLTEEQARAIHSIAEVKMVKLPMAPEADWPDTPDGLGIKGLYFEAPGIVMGQHAHKIGHTHLVGSGELRVWVEGVESGDFKAGQTIWLQPFKRHMMMSLKADTRGFCITNVGVENPVVALSECPAEVAA